MSEKTTVTKAQDVQEISTSTPYTFTHEDVLKFFIGLRLLGKTKQKRFLLYMTTIKAPIEGKEGEKTNEL
jgi:hypothetical protein